MIAIGLHMHMYFESFSGKHIVYLYSPHCYTGAEQLNIKESRFHVPKCVGGWASSSFSDTTG